MGEVRYGGPICEARVACDGGEVSTLSGTPVCARCKDTIARRRRIAKENAKIDKLMKQAETPLPEDRRTFAGRPPRKPRTTKQVANKA